jgi:hypothetical protein
MASPETRRHPPDGRLAVIAEHKLGVHTRQSPTSATADPKAFYKSFPARSNSRFAAKPNPGRPSQRVLLDRTGDGRKYVVGIGTDKPNGPDHDYQNHCQHHRVFRDILALVAAPQTYSLSFHLLSS